MALMNALSAFWSPIGGFRTQLCWRMMGFALCQVRTGDRIWPQIAGAVLIVFGPRLITLGTAAASGIAVLVSILTFPLSAELAPAEEFLVFPGMDELFALLEVNRHARSGDYEVVVVDCAPTAETLRLLSLPEVLSWYFEKVLPTERRIMKAARPILSRLTDLPIPEDEVFSAAQSVFESIEEVRELMSQPEVTSARLVVNPEKMVIDEARRTYSYLSLFGYGVDGVVVNRVLPDMVTDPYFDRWRSIQKQHLDEIDEGFADVPRLRLRLFDDEMIGTDRLRLMASELYGDTDPVFGFKATSPFRITVRNGAVTMELDLPLVDKSDLDVFRHGRELYVRLGPYRSRCRAPP